MTLKVAAVKRDVDIDLLFLDSKILSLDDVNLRLRSKIRVALGLMQKHSPCEGSGTDHYGATSAGTNCLLDG